MFESILITALECAGHHLSTEQIGQLDHHFEAMNKANQVMNLTRITDPHKAAVMHYADSLCVLHYLKEHRIEPDSVLDVGTGAGLPAYPLAVAQPDWSIHAIDGTKKKIDFVNEAVKAGGIKNLLATHAHSSHWSPDNLYPLVICRALAKLPEAIREVAKLVAVGGLFAAYKTASIGSEEFNKGKQTASKCGLRLHDRYLYSLKLGSETLARELIIFQKK